MTKGMKIGLSVLAVGITATAVFLILKRRKKKKEEKKAQPATDAGARARRKLKDKEHNKYVNFLHADDD